MEVSFTTLACCMCGKKCEEINHFVLIFCLFTPALLAQNCRQKFPPDAINFLPFIGFFFFVTEDVLFCRRVVHGKIVHYFICVCTKLLLPFLATGTWELWLVMPYWETKISNCLNISFTMFCTKIALS